MTGPNFYAGFYTALLFGFYPVKEQKNAGSLI
jgi:hypothetical protein